VQIIKPTIMAKMSAALGLAALLCAGAGAQTYPAKPIRFVVPFAPGGTAEIVGRVIGQELQKHIGQTVIVELKPGAGGNIGAEMVAHSEPDGYTLLLGSSSLASNVSLMKMNFDPRKDLIAVAGISMVPNILVVGSNSPYKTMADLLAAAKAQPGKLTFGSSGPGTSSHLSGELFKSVTGADILHVPYKGSGQVYPDLIAGRVDMLFDLQGSALYQIGGGKVRPLAVTTKARLADLPDVPTLAETVLPGFDIVTWYGMWVPKDTPEPIVAKLNQAMIEASRSPKVVEALKSQGTLPSQLSYQEAEAFNLAESQRWIKVMKDAGIQPE